MNGSTGNNIDELDDIKKPSKLPKLIIVLFILLGALFAGYHFVKKKKILSDMDIPFIKADPSPVKAEPLDPGGMVVPNMDKSVYDNLSASKDSENKKKNVEEKVLPAPEEPIKLDEINDNQKEEPLAQKDGSSFSLTKVVKTKASKKIAHVKNMADNRESKEIAGASFTIQVMSMKNFDKANSHIKLLRNKFSKDLEGLEPRIEKVDFGDDKGIFFRLQFTGISSKTNAAKLCSKLKKLGQDCFVVKN